MKDVIRIGFFIPFFPIFIIGFLTGLVVRFFYAGWEACDMFAEWVHSD